jgi:hypothetical protein
MGEISGWKIWMKHVGEMIFIYFYSMKIVKFDHLSLAVLGIWTSEVDELNKGFELGQPISMDD